MTQLTVRPLRASDAGDVLDAFRSDPRMERQGTVRTFEEAEHYVSDLLYSPTQHPFAIADEDRLVGLICVTVEPVNQIGGFWYWMNASHRGRGWASRSAIAVANWALSSGHCQRLELGHRADNPLSGNVAGFAGFVREGRARGKLLIDGQRVDLLTYGRLAADPWPQADVEILW
ncbi:MAG TPA: GNAT family protein [Arachnia sp.]|nr:GNAT family protein [Arachnia sp.]HMT86908.1 GNAT family protein [Arachnia sp.]